jgi:dolichol-phosphate mannosyltransferase
MLLSVVLPTYNERENIAHLIERVERALGDTRHELIFVDDSTDGTDTEIASHIRRYPHIILAHRKTREGLAAAVVDGIRRARGDVICVLDADLQHPPEAIPLLIEALERTNAEVAVASRNIPGGGYEAFSAARRAASRVATVLARSLLARARLVSDPMSGFFAVRKDAVQSIPLRPVGYKILLEVLVRGRVGGVVEVPYLFQARGTGTSKLRMRQQWEYLIHLLRLATVQPDDSRFLRFCFVGATGSLVNMGVLWSLTARGVHYILAGIMAAAVATTWNFFLNDSYTWRDRRSPSRRTKIARYARYWMVTGTSSAVQVALLFFLTTVGVPYLVSNIIGIGTAAIYNFWANSSVTWKSTRPPVVRAVYRRCGPEAVDPVGGATGVSEL